MYLDIAGEVMENTLCLLPAVAWLDVTRLSGSLFKPHRLYFAVVSVPLSLFFKEYQSIFIFKKLFFYCLYFFLWWDYNRGSDGKMLTIDSIVI